VVYIYRTQAKPRSCGNAGTIAEDSILPRKLIALCLLAGFAFALESCAPIKNVKVPSAGMEPTILAEEEITVDMEAYEHSRPKPGDLVVLGSSQSLSSLAVRRCVAVGGQTVEIRAG
jgi:signal peptidase I